MAFFVGAFGAGRRLFTFAGLLLAAGAAFLGAFRARRGPAAGLLLAGGAAFLGVPLPLAAFQYHRMPSVEIPNLSESDFRISTLGSPALILAASSFRSASLFSGVSFCLAMTFSSSGTGRGPILPVVSGETMAAVTSARAGVVSVSPEVLRRQRSPSGTTSTWVETLHSGQATELVPSWISNCTMPL